MSKKTIESIVEGGNDYVVQVKGNQKKLKSGIQEYVDKNNNDDRYYEKEKNKGRDENRETKVYKNVKGSEFAKWKGIRDIIVVHRWGIREDEEFDETHYFISSRKNSSAKIYAKGIRRHWWIENKLHWVKDVILKEDDSLIKDKQLAENLSLIRIIVMNLYRLRNYESIKYAIEKYVNRLDECNKFIYKNFRSE